MIALSLNNVTLVLGGRTLFSNLTWTIGEDQKIGLIGPNGAGKSSLFKVIMGEYEPEAGGNVARAKGVRVGYLAQDPVLDPGLSAYEAALAGSERMREVKAELAAVEARMGTPEVYENERKLSEALATQQRLLEEYQLLGGDQYEQRVHDLLRGLGLEEGEFVKPLGVLSGGQKKLVGLARLMLSAPDVLLLDEPDNHLDLAGKVFLERLVREYKGAVVIISHDRYLLDAAVTAIAEMEDGRLSTFEGDYSAYILDKQTRLARQNELFQVQQHQITRIEAAIKRYSIWAKVYDNEKFAKRARSIQNRLDKMERLDRPVLERRRMDLRLHGWRGSHRVLQLRGVRKAFGERVILKDANLVLHHGERVGVIGRNGTGKSVLLRLAQGSEQADGG